MIYSRLLLFVVLLWIVLIGGVYGVLYFGLFSGLSRLQPGELQVISESSEPFTVVPYAVEVVATGLEVPWSLAFTGSDRILVTERPGRLRVIASGKLQQKPLHVFTDVSNTDEEGLMSIVLDPEYTKNKYVYVSYAYTKNKVMQVKVARFRDDGDHLSDEYTVIDGIPAAHYHSGSRLLFGPDGKLYITTGDSFDKNLAQKLDSLAGKTLRLNSDGSIPNDNPFPNSPVWTYGNRNSQGIAWNHFNNTLYESEHGPSVVDGPAGGDEINVITKGANYGWPLVSHDRTRAGTEAPIITFTPAEAPGSLMVYSGQIFPQFKGNLFFGALVGQGIVRVIINPEKPNKILQVEKLKDIAVGRVRDITEGPDGSIYFTSSNRDGRGKPKTGDDKVYKLVPATAR